MPHEGGSGGSPSKAHRCEEEAVIRGGAGRHSMSAATIMAIRAFCCASSAVTLKRAYACCSQGM